MRSPHSPFSAERTSEGNLSSTSPLTTNCVEEISLLLVDLEGAVSGLSRHGRRGLSGSIGLAISDTKIAGVLNHTRFLLCIPGGAGLHRAVSQPFFVLLWWRRRKIPHKYINQETVIVGLVIDAEKEGSLLCPDHGVQRFVGRMRALPAEDKRPLPFEICSVLWLFWLGNQISGGALFIRAPEGQERDSQIFVDLFAFVQSVGREGSMRSYIERSYIEKL